MAARPGWWWRTCTSGRAPSGCAALTCSITTSPASGRPTVTTSTETHGRNSGTRATDLADRHGRPGDGRDTDGADYRARTTVLGRPPGRSAPRRPADRRGRLFGRAVLPDRVAPGRAGGDHRSAAGRRRGIAVPARRTASRRRA